MKYLIVQVVASPLGEKYNIPRLLIECGNNRVIQLDISPKELEIQN
jgi:hypothetical protein